jgi:hypothetical protein
LRLGAAVLVVLLLAGVAAVIVDGLDLVADLLVTA